jgi:hypothetical protein
MEYIYVRLINCHFHLFQSSASSFSSQYLLLFLKSSRSYFLLHIPFTYIICLLRSVLFSPIRSRACSLVTFSDHFYLLYSPQVPHFKALQILPLQFLVSRSLSHIKKCSKPNT